VRKSGAHLTRQEVVAELITAPDLVLALKVDGTLEEHVARFTIELAKVRAEHDVLVLGHEPIGDRGDPVPNS
jgi:hypothetical protein